MWLALWPLGFQTVYCWGVSLQLRALFTACMRAQCVRSVSLCTSTDVCSLYSCPIQALGLDVLSVCAPGGLAA